ncbi:MAG TPA: hypothetical protein VFB50_00990 [Chloroflexota bacterium]|nr:hypothetical protein [Chloroflexota bacterium]
MTNYKNDADFANEHAPEMERILARNLLKIVSIKPASRHQDQCEATDCIIATNIGEIAFRVRRERCNFADVTFRYQRLRNGIWVGGFEVDKILGGYCRAYLYAWQRR